MQRTFVLNDAAKKRIVSSSTHFASPWQPEARIERCWPGHVAAPGCGRQRKRKGGLRAALEFLARHQAFFDQQCRQAGEGALVIVRRPIVARLHALDGVAVFVHVEDAHPDRQRVHGIDAFFPGRMKGLRLR